MKIVNILCALVFLGVFQAQARHIEGGEITLEHISGYKYLLKVNIYKLTNNQGPIDAYTPVYFYDKASNTLLGEYNVPQVSVKNITVQNSGTCSTTSLNTTIYTYADTITLDPAKYSGSQGFYGAYSLCCRDESTVNLATVSNSQQGQGAVYYSEFPPIATYVDSSPYFTSFTKNSYACQNAPFTYDFSATDADGDSLVYSLSIPLRGAANSGASEQATGPAPYAAVTFATGYSLTNMVHGSPPLTINSVTGILSVTPTTIGMHVFAVTCKEYRNGVYLGEVIRDFELYVTSCSKNSVPSIKLKDPITQVTETANDTLLLNFKQGGCISVLIVESQTNQTVTVQAKGINFLDGLVISPESMTIAKANDTATVKVCIPPCPTVAGSLLRVRIIVENYNECTVPSYDTLNVVLKDSATSLISPKIRFRLPPSKDLHVSGDTISADLSEATCFNVLYIDNLLKKYLSAEISSVNFSEKFTAADTFIYNINSTIVVDTATLPVCFPACFKSGQQVLKLKVAIAAIVNSCPRSYYDTSYIYINNTGFRVSPPKKPEVVFKDPSTGLLYAGGDTISLNLLRPRCLGLLAYDASAGSSIIFTAAGVDFKDTVTVNPDMVTITGTSDTAKVSLCLPSCPNTNDSILTVMVDYLSEYNCSSTREDSSYIHVKNTGFYNIPPVISTSLSPNSIEIMVNHTLAFDVFATSGSPHLIYLSEKGTINNSTFTPVSGYNNISSQFTFAPSCKELSTAPYEAKFVARDSTCKGVLSDSVVVYISVKDTSNKQIFPNVITPNGDQVNDYFEISHFPPDNCSGSFSQVEIYNRWGKMVFSDSNREFRWYADDLPVGLYYYVVKFTHADYKSWILVER